MDDGCDFCAYAGLRKSVLNSDESAGLDDALDYGIAVERLDGPEVDDFAGNALLRQDLRRLQRVLNVAGVADYGGVLALSHDLSFADWNHVIRR